MPSLLIDPVTLPPTSKKNGIGVRANKRKSCDEKLLADESSLKKTTLENADSMTDNPTSPLSSGSSVSSTQFAISASTPTSGASTPTSGASTPTSVASTLTSGASTPTSGISDSTATDRSDTSPSGDRTQSINTPTPPRGPPIIKAGLLDVNKHLRFQDLSINKNGTRSVAVCSADMATSKVYVQLGTNSGGSIPPFGLMLPDSDNNAPKLILSVSDAVEYESLSRKFKEDAIQTAFDSREKWWNNPVTMSQLTDGYYNILPEGRLKKDGNGTWDPQIKLKLPMTDAGDLDPKQCDIRDADGSPISIYDLPGRKWEKLILKLTSVYFLSKYSWGFSKSLVKLVLAPDDRINEDPSQISFV